MCPLSSVFPSYTPTSFDTHFQSPSSSVGSPPVLYLPDQSPLTVRICDWNKHSSPSGPAGPGVLLFELHIELEWVQASCFQVRPTLVSVQTCLGFWFFLFAPIQTKGKDWISFQCALFYSVTDDDCWRLGLFVWCIHSVLQLFDIIIVKFVILARPYFKRLHF